MTFDPKTCRKRMTVGKLSLLLQELPQDALVEAVNVLNLFVSDAETDDAIAFIDFNHEIVGRY